MGAPRAGFTREVFPIQRRREIPHSADSVRNDGVWLVIRIFMRQLLAAIHRKSQKPYTQNPRMGDRPNGIRERMEGGREKDNAETQKAQSGLCSEVRKRYARAVCRRQREKNREVRATLKKKAKMAAHEAGKSVVSGCREGERSPPHGGARGRALGEKQKEKGRAPGGVPMESGRAGSPALNGTGRGVRRRCRAGGGHWPRGRSPGYRRRCGY